VSPESCKTILFVDYENTGKIDLNQIPESTFVPFFFGAAQRSVPTEFLEAALKIGDRFQPIKIEGVGDNALDFHIAFYLGEYLVAHPKANCIILTKDTGFDPLVKHLRGRGFQVRRAATLADAFGSAKTNVPKPAKPKPAPAKPKEKSPYEVVLNWLTKMEPRTRPKKRTGLMAHIHSHFGRDFSEPDLHGVVERLIAEKKISEVDGVLGYAL
jgi:PIN domain